jgi:trigger factor
VHFANVASLGRLAMSGKTQLPTVEAPKLDGVSVKLPTPADLDPGRIAERLMVLARRFATRRDRKPGDAMAMGDDICVDMLGYAAGKLIPFSPSLSAWVPLLPSSQLPGLFEQLVGKKVGAGARIELRLPKDFPLETLRGAKAVYLVDVVAAREVEVPNVESEGFLRKLGRGPTLEVAMKSIVNDLVTERAEELQLQAINQVLDILVSRTQIQIPEALVDDQIRALWRENEEPLLSKKGLSPAEQLDAVNGWISDPFSRKDVTRRLAVTAVVKAIAQRDGIKVTPQALKALGKQTGEAMGVDGKTLDAALSEGLPDEMTESALHLLTVEHVMKKAKVQFGDAPRK